NKRSWLVAGACLLAAIIGYFLAIPPISSGGNGETIALAGGGSRKIDGPGVHGAAGNGISVKQRTAEQLESLKRDLFDRFKNSPSAAHDWTLRAQPAVIL